HKALAELVSSTGSPSGGWSAFKKYYVPQAAAEKARLTQSWHSLRMKDGETTNEYCSRCCVLRSRLSTHGMLFPDIDTNHHFARNLSSVF
ncbi:unnamed protein product, partial [Scytosiphon promiscuus]